MQNTFWDKIIKLNGSTVLFEGTRDLSIGEYEKLFQVGNRLAKVLPASTFRSGKLGDDISLIQYFLRH